MNITLLLPTLGWLLSLSGLACAQAPQTVIPIVLVRTAGTAERYAAQDLATALQRLYPHDQFIAQEQLPEAGRCILLGCSTDAQIQQRLGAERLTTPESYRVTTASEGPRELGVIAGADVRGVAFGVYALLEQLGCGFYLSYDAFPPPRSEAFSFTGWQLAAQPLVRDRLVFDWHNFLSGCSTWNPADWDRWTDQSLKMGFNAIMVHAYGNNPMVSYEFNGKQKPVGYLSTTVKGRDWSTMHVNDVRRLWGGEVFSQPAFGAAAALGPDDQRAEAARKLMSGVLAHAGQRGMEVFFATDVDTGSANPQELILTLPESARFVIQAAAGGLSGLSGQGQQAFWLANPDTPEGDRYYRTQVASLLQTYPQITNLVVWFRGGGTPWMELPLAAMPATWQQEFQAEINQTPAVAKLWHAPQIFALGKVVRAFDRALKELGHGRIQLAAGTWDFKFLAPCDRFFPPHVKLIGLDYNVLHDQPQLATAESRQVISKVAAHRSVVPVVWAHHDDGNYIGRPYTPFAEFNFKLADAKASGFGIIHWTTRPLDLFFKSLAAQTWSDTKDQPLRATCDAMAARSFGTSASDAMATYLERWVNEAPKFGRETSDWFIDQPLKNIEPVITGCRERLKLIAQVDEAKLSAEQQARLGYCRGLEEFIAAFFQTHGIYQRSQALLKAGDLAGARAVMAQCQPEQVIEQFAKFSALAGITRGEQGLVVSLNTRWLTHLIRHRQALGLEPVRINFAPTQHDKLAQSRGTFTFHIAPDRNVWECWGTEETGAKVFSATAPADAEIGGTGVESDQPLTFVLQPIMARDSRGRSGPVGLPAGAYRLRLWLRDPVSNAPDQRVFDVAADSCGGPDCYTFDAVSARFLRVLCHGNSVSDWNSLVDVRLDAVEVNGHGPAVSASAAVDGFPAVHACDGNPLTRWAARGANQWLQFRLAQGTIVRNIGLEWYAADQRKARFEIQVSDDGNAWQPVRNLRRAAASSRAVERVDIFRLAGVPDHLIERTYDITVGSSGTVKVTLTPVTGRVLICGAVLEPLKLAGLPPSPE